MCIRDRPIRAGMRDRTSEAGGGESQQTLSRLERRLRSTGLRAPRGYPGALRCRTALRVAAMSRVLVVSRPSCEKKNTKKEKKTRGQTRLRRTRQKTELTRPFTARARSRLR
eukprot:6192291-Prymnesium_polylepis.1